MGNQNLTICCAQQPGNNVLFTLKDSAPAESPMTLTPQQQTFIDSQNPFPNQLKKLVTLKINKEDTFQGELDEKGNPTGFGIFRTKDEPAVYAGKFNQQGVEGGKLFYLLPDGAYFEGNLMAEALISGSFIQPQNQYSYKGELDHRPGQQLRYIPHGTGIQTCTNYTFEGTFSNGKRTKGKLQWSEASFINSYEGAFDEDQLFTGKGVLKEKSGVFNGDFVKGKKQGHGKYEYGVGLIYEGEYKQGNKNGRGKLSNFDGTVSYEGEFKDGLPHGHGTAFPNNKTPYQTEFYEGITKQNYVVLAGEAAVSKTNVQQ